MAGDSDANGESPAATKQRVGKFTVTKIRIPEGRDLHVDKNFFDDRLVRMKTKHVEVRAEDERVWIERVERAGSVERSGGSEEEAGSLYQQTIHGISDVSRRPAVPKAEPREAKRSTFMRNFRAAFHPKASAPPPRDGSAHPHGDSDAKYYHTVTASPSAKRPGAIHRMMDIFRGRQPTFARKGSERRPARAQHQGSQTTQPSQPSQQAQQPRVDRVGRRRRRERGDPSLVAEQFKRARGLPDETPFLDRLRAEPNALAELLARHRCHELMPISAKLIAFDVRLTAKKAFHALVQNGVRAAPLWDSERRRFVGMFTITDFIKMLHKNYRGTGAGMEELEERRLGAWRDELVDPAAPLVHASPDDSLRAAVEKLVAHKIHRLPLMDPETGDVLYILTHKRVLKFLFLYVDRLPRPPFMDRGIRDLGVGTYEDIEVVREDATVIEALKKFVRRRVSALPVVDAEGRLRDIYARFDVINLAAEKTYDDLDAPLARANSHRNEWTEGVLKCTADETLYEAARRMVGAEVHRLVVVDPEDRVLGMVSQSDVLRFIILEAPNEPAETAGPPPVARAAFDVAEERDRDDSSEESLDRVADLPAAGFFH